MELVDLITPSLAAFAAIVALGLGIQAFRQGRHIRRLEHRINEMGVAGTSAPLERLAQLQKRISTSSGVRPAPEAGRKVVIGLAAVVGLAAIGAAGWWFLLRDPGDGGVAGQTTPTTAQTITGPATTTSISAPVPANPCAGVAAIADPGAVTVALFNASGVEGAALQKTWPKLQVAGYSQGQITNSPDQRTDLPTSVVMFAKAGDKPAACAVAKEIKVKKVIALDGYTVDQIGGENTGVLVVVGLDLANR